MTRARLLPLVLLAGCWMRVEQQMMERSETMEGHLTGIFDGVRALEAQDAGAFRASMRSLERGGEVPGVEVGQDLEHLHTLARAARNEKSQGARAEGLIAVAAHCGVCHTAHSVATPPLFEVPTAFEQALSAVVWTDDAHWAGARERLPLLSSEPSWGARRASLSAQLALPPP